MFLFADWGEKEGKKVKRGVILFFLKHLILVSVLSITNMIYEEFLEVFLEIGVKLI